MISPPTSAYAPTFAPLTTGDGICAFIPRWSHRKTRTIVAFLVGLFPWFFVASCCFIVLSYARSFVEGGERLTLVGQRHMRKLRKHITQELMEGKLVDWKEVFQRKPRGRPKSHRSSVLSTLVSDSDSWSRIFDLSSNSFHCFFNRQFHISESTKIVQG